VGPFSRPSRARGASRATGAPRGRVTRAAARTGSRLRRRRRALARGDAGAGDRSRRPHPRLGSSVRPAHRGGGAVPVRSAAALRPPRLVPAGDPGDQVRDPGRLRGHGRARQEPSPGRRLRQLRGPAHPADRGREGGGVRARPPARALPRHRGRYGAHRPHHRGDPPPAAGGVGLDRHGERGRAGPRSHGERPGIGRPGLALYRGLDRLSGLGRRAGAWRAAARASRRARGGPGRRSARAAHPARAAGRPRVAPEPARDARLQRALLLAQGGPAPRATGAGPISSPTSPSSTRWTRSATGIASTAAGAFSSTSA
jgi:hypothetical protein